MADTKISALTTDSAPHRTNDFAPTYDASAVANKKVALRDFGILSLIAEFSNSSPADATTYYFGAWGNTVLQTGQGARRIHILRAGIITKAIVYAEAGGGSAETSTLSLRYNATTDTTLTSAFTTNAGFIVVVAISVSVAENSFVEIKWVTPTWATNPTGLYGRVTLLME